MKLLADIASGNTNWADIFFLIAVILFFLAALAHFRPLTADWSYTLGIVSLGLGFTALGLLVL